MHLSYRRKNTEKVDPLCVCSRICRRFSPTKHGLSHWCTRSHIVHIRTYQNAIYAECTLFQLWIASSPITQCSCRVVHAETFFRICLKRTGSVCIQPEDGDNSEFGNSSLDTRFNPWMLKVYKDGLKRHLHSKSKVVQSTNTSWHSNLVTEWLR